MKKKSLCAGLLVFALLWALALAGCTLISGQNASATPVPSASISVTPSAAQLSYKATAAETSAANTAAATATQTVNATTPAGAAGALSASASVPEKSVVAEASTEELIATQTSIKITQTSGSVENAAATGAGESSSAPAASLKTQEPAGVTAAQTHKVVTTENSMAGNTFAPAPSVEAPAFSETEGAYQEADLYDLDRLILYGLGFVLLFIILIIGVLCYIGSKISIISENSYRLNQLVNSIKEEALVKEAANAFQLQEIKKIASDNRGDIERRLDNIEKSGNRASYADTEHIYRSAGDLEIKTNVEPIVEQDKMQEFLKIINEANAESIRLDSRAKWEEYLNNRYGAKNWWYAMLKMTDSPFVLEKGDKRGRFAIVDIYGDTSRLALVPQFPCSNASNDSEVKCLFEVSNYGGDGKSNIIKQPAIAHKSTEPGKANFYLVDRNCRGSIESR